jgi:hypothetical protein
MTTTTSATVTSAPVRPVVDGWTVVPVHTTVGGQGQLVYDVPPPWQPVDAPDFDSDSEYSYLMSAAQNPSATCAVNPSASGAFFDRSQGPSSALATRYAKGLATAAFSLVSAPPQVQASAARSVSGPGWTGKLVVARATLAKPLSCGLSKGAVALVALSTEADPDRTVMVATFAGQDSGDGTGVAQLTKIVESVRLTS